MDHLLIAKTAKKTIPLLCLTEKTYDSWIKDQEPETALWLKSQEFKAKAGAFSCIPSAQGGVEAVVAIVSVPTSLWDIAALSTKLPHGLYALSETMAIDDQEKLALGWLLGAYKMTRYKKAEKEPSTLVVSPKTDVKSILTTAKAIALVRDMINTPANDMGPEEIAKAVEAQAQTYGAKVTQIIGDALLKKGYGGIHAVGRASVKQPRLIDLTWGDAKNPKVTLIGKGVCFDTGGLDLKPSSGMLTMKKDMAGSACALGVASLIMAKKLPVRLRLLIPAVENAVSGNAYRPGDIITMKSGKTVEITNTDAEGRMILADALTEACEEKPDLLIDFATLTGAARVALGTEISAFFTDDEDLAHKTMKHGHTEEDPMWRMPFYKDYDTQLDSKLADMVNASSSGYAGAITAALFLKRFVDEKTRWMHIDFMAANTSSKAGRPEGGEAMALRTITALIEEFAQKDKKKKK